MARANFQLTSQIVAAHAGSRVVCLAAEGVDRTWPLYPQRPGPEFNTAISASDSYYPLGASAEPVEPSPAVLRVDIRGPIEETAGYHDPCAGWTDGNDAISERLCAAFAEGDVLLCIHSPGGDPSGAPEGMRRAAEAKAAYGRRCTVHTEGMVASLGLWWAFAVGDEFYASSDARIGSIGARGAHGSIAGALAKEGVVVTYSAWPDEGKIAQAPELPLSPLGKERNDRDVATIGEMFGNAVASSPIGMRHGITIDSIRALHADVLTGAAAMAAGLVDGIATFEQTAEWALESAGTGPTGDTMTIQAADDKPPADDEDDNDPHSTRSEGMQPSGACKSCGMANRPEAKFCDQCGESMAAPPMDDQPEKPADKGGARAKPAPVAAHIVSIPALRTALARADRTLSAVAAMVGAKTHGEILGAVEAVAKDARNAKRYRDERNEARATSAARERMDLLASLYTKDPAGHPRGKLVVDVIDPATNKASGMRPAELWGDGPKGRTLENLRAYTRATLDGLSTTEPNPYDRAPREASADAATSRVADAHVEAAKGTPAVQIAIDDGIDPKIAAESYARRFGAHNGVAP